MVEEIEVTGAADVIAGRVPFLTNAKEGNGPVGSRLARGVAHQGLCLL